MSSSSSSKKSVGLFSFLVMIAIFLAGYAKYLMLSQQHLDYQADALAPSRVMIKPQFVVDAISNGGYFGTLLAVLLHVLNSALLFGVVFALMYLAVTYFPTVRNRYKPIPDPKTTFAPGEYECEIKGSEILIMIAGKKNPKTGVVGKGIIDKQPYRQVFFRCNRALLKLSRVPTGPYDHLYVAVHSVLAAHPDVPASIGAHHADTSLLNHSLAIAKDLVSYMSEKSWVEPLARIAGMAHDMDKLLAYTQKDGAWVKTKDCTHHNSFSAYIVSNMPEFEALSVDDKAVLTLALRYYHHPHMLPLDCGPRTERLVQALRHVDGFVIRKEKKAGIEDALAGVNTHHLIEKALNATIADLNINNYRLQGLAGGWTKNAYDYVIVPMSTVLENIGSHLPQQISRQLQVSVDSRSFHHPAIGVIMDVLDRMDLLMRDHKELVSESGLFDVKIGAKSFRACILLNKQRLEELLPTTVIKWGMSEYKISVQRAAVSAKSSDEDSDDGEDAASGDDEN
jgi:hypothetical protein